MHICDVSGQQISPLRNLKTQMDSHLISEIIDYQYRCFITWYCWTATNWWIPHCFLPSRACGCLVAASVNTNWRCGRPLVRKTSLKVTVRSGLYRQLSSFIQIIMQVNCRRRTPMVYFALIMTLTLIILLPRVIHLRVVSPNALGLTKVYFSLYNSSRQACVVSLKTWIKWEQLKGVSDYHSGRKEPD